MFERGNKEKKRKKIPTMLDFLDSMKMMGLFLKKISPQTQKNKELIGTISRILQMYLLAQMQKIILLDCKEIFMKCVENTSDFYSMFGKPCIPHSLLYPLLLLSCSYPQEKREMLLSQVSSDEWRPSFLGYLKSKIEMAQVLR